MEKRDLSSEAEEECVKKTRVVLDKGQNGPSARILEKMGGEKGSAGKGLDVKLHPLLRKSFNLPSTITTSSRNPLKQSRLVASSSSAFNPYISQTSSLIANSHKPKPLKFNLQGKFISKGDKFREQLRLENEERQKHDQLAEQGLLANENLREDHYRLQFPPLVEWWDRPYLRDNNYTRINDENRLVLDNEEQPITCYIQHPVLLEPIWEQTTSHNAPIPMFLTAKEKKRMRKNDRQIRHKEKQDRIKLGLDPPPPPKVKLSNLMTVLTNEAIKDPTAVENKVRKQVEERLQKHLRDNEARKLTSEQKRAKIFARQEKDIANGVYTTIFKINSLDNPSHFYKVDINAKQGNLFGICLKNPKFNLVVVEGGEKSMKHYKKLLMNRIKWSETGDEENTGLSKCKILWEGRLPQINFEKWSIMYSRNDEEAIKVLKKFGMENYWTIAQDSQESTN
ncbi:PRP3 [Candida oxycetoniae]|uniref:PRP3 n=1 Tax=Candida oxycetoniae TaxID=497107 RepID=A0AAI9SX38_9ASCO|nr:PRP3 [Candida oxycetoniae]KAI3404722.2 PRP3 [Candida oxycetoniae]